MGTKGNQSMNVTVTTVQDADDRYGPRFYYLHRDNIKAQIAAIQAQRGVACPSHVTQWQLRSVNGHTANALLPYKGRRLDFRQ